MASVSKGVLFVPVIKKKEKKIKGKKIYKKSRPQISRGKR